MPLAGEPVIPATMSVRHKIGGHVGLLNVKDFDPAIWDAIDSPTTDASSSGELEHTHTDSEDVVGTKTSAAPRRRGKKS